MFVSYNSADQQVVHRITERLRGERLEPWLDKWILTPGRPWQEEIVEGLAQASTCAVMVGPSGLGDWAREELAVAQDRAAKDRDFRMFMVLLPGAPDVNDPGLAFLRTRTWVDMRSGTADPAAFQDLVNAITGTARAPAPSDDQHADVACPYRGLESFDAEHAEYFFGREDDTAHVLEMLRSGRFVAVLGPSGSGKSSLVRAGVVHALQCGRLPGSETWTTRVFRPGAHPLTVLAAQLARVFPEKSMQRTLDELGDDERTLDLAVTLAFAEQPHDGRLVLVADQFEEAFTLCTDEEERQAFIANLLYAATIPGGRVAVILAMRADFYHLCANNPDLRTLVASRQFLVGPLSADGLRRAIEEPARRVGVELETGLLETILADIGDRPGTLPLLQHMLFEVWQRRRGRMLTLEAYVASGKLEGALAKRANAVYEAMPAHEQEIARRVLLRLVQPGEGTEDTRRRAAIGELVRRDDERDVVEGVVEALAGERLVTPDHDEVSGARVVDITHEALIRGWPELRSWIAEDRDRLRAHRRLTETALDWDRNGRDDGLLYRGARLAEWDDRDLGDLNDLEQAFLAASRQRQHRERAASRRRARIAVGGVLAAITAVATVALVGLAQVAQERDLAGSRLAVANSAAQLDREPLRALLLALEAYELRPTEESEQAVRLAVLRSKVLAALQVTAPTEPAFSPDGRFVAVGGGDGGVRLWEWAGGAPPRLLAGHPPGPSSGDFSPDGRLVVTTGVDGTIRLWDAATAAAGPVLSGHEGPVARARFSSDGKRLVSVGVADGSVRIWDVESRSSVMVLRTPEAAPTSARFSPDGDAVVTGGSDGAVRIWDWEGGRLARVLAGHAGAVTSVAFSDNGGIVVSGGGGDGTVRVWDVATGQATVLKHQEGPVLGIGLSRDGRFVVGAGLAGTVRVWEWATGEQAAELRGHEEVTTGVSFSDDGHHVVSAGYDGTARVWDWRSEANRTVLQAPGALFTAAWSPSGRLAVGAGEDGVVRVVDRASRAEVRSLTGHEGAVAAVEVSEDGRSVLSGGFDGTLRLWDLEGDRSVVMTGHQGGVANVALAPDGASALSAGVDGTVRLWDRATGRELKRLALPRSVTSASLSGDGAVLLTSSIDGAVRLTDWATGTERRAFTGHEGSVHKAIFSPDGRRVASAGSDGTVRIWDVAGGARRVLRGHQGLVASISFSSDGRLMVTAGVDETVRVWDLATGRGLVAMRGHNRGVASVRFAPSGLDILSAGFDGTLRVWDCRTCGPREEVLATARERAVRELTAEERAAFLPRVGSSGVGIVPVVLVGLVVVLVGAGGLVLMRRSSKSGRVATKVPSAP